MFRHGVIVRFKRSPAPFMSNVRALSLLGLLFLLAACAGRRQTADSFVMGQAGATARAKADSARLPYTQADIDFMRGMIHHHAQAILISQWAPTHDAAPAVRRLTERIINAQRDEIRTMQTWLVDRNQASVDVDSAGNVTMDHSMHGEHGGHAMHTMPGMLSEAQLKELDAARGPEFDRLFLIFMMAHHKGAITMVRTLFSAQGAGQDETVFRFASDVQVDQSTEIKRMLTMLLEMGFAPPAP
jgi:uncharacterized protein (DUF305 family)